jgi:hypothetical protein
MLFITIKSYFDKSKNGQNIYLIYYFGGNDELSKSFEIKVRDKNKRTNLGNIYLDKIYTEIAMILKVKVTSFIK